ncbi:SAM-dependent methyltransferase [Putridiphycobacter roseus]|uniref:SAM-dependent methyltransferase n=1 Tax=Putridiphycobacter roseus TaxID=2219161 RepID=A0A2W1NFL8_9FLAO|nr:class I SAM-dependent methyltransferase [Putridiphycobacter roseus]PZE16816.1 SAM-dependent methyltransferase [Putridiphycobacter roseus]
MFTTKEVASYYDTTLIHYRQWWGLKKNLSLHYGLWTKGISSFSEALANTNKVLLSHTNIDSKSKVLDAGCGVGGAAIYIHQKTQASITGLTLSKKQIEFAMAAAQEKNIVDAVNFLEMDFTYTTFPSETFDVVWACESICNAINKAAFIQEAYRLLKPGGQLIMCDFYKKSQQQKDRKAYMKKWGDTWGVPQFETVQFFKSEMLNKGFNRIKTFDHTSDIKKSAKKLYRAALLGALPSMLYNVTHPKVSYFAKNHYKCGYYQYKALQENLWEYQIITGYK